MAHRVRLQGSSRAFTAAFRRELENAGLEAVVEAVESVTGARRATAKDLLIYEIKKKAELQAFSRKRSVRPFLVFTKLELRHDEISFLKEKGLMGVIRPDTSPEDIFFHVNKAIFCNRMIKRNARAPVNMPVEIIAGQKKISTVSSLLSRDGMFIVTLNPLPLNCVCELAFKVPGIGKDFRTGARVLYNVPVNRDLNIISSPQDPFKRFISHPGMAVFFLDLPAQDRELIDRYVKSLD
ncbi:MAG: hypothetical protein HZB22_08125 [Deltaproteobacteria bacterium]|nr:hypothetical protein [Deltaproteobacteria bacterium]